MVEKEAQAYSSDQTLMAKGNKGFRVLKQRGENGETKRINGIVESRGIVL